MLTKKGIDRVCSIVLILTILLGATFTVMAKSDMISASAEAAYEKKLFDETYVHEIDIVMDNWDELIENAVSEEYYACTVVIDGEKYADIGIRGKGNTSLSSVASYGNDRYSFKLEFDKYRKGRSYYGLDKLCLNNIISDNTYMKDYLCYKMMRDMGVPSPLCSYVWITVNGEDWGLYLAVEGVEEAFLKRNYGSDYGELYKPDSMSMGGGAGNGRDFNMDDFRENFNSSEESATEDTAAADTSNKTKREKPSGNFGGGGGGGGTGSSDVKLQYIDDDTASYSNIFDNAKTDATDSDKERLISSLKALSEGNSSAVDIESVIAYFVVHTFVLNGDSYTGSMIHNYYLYEEDSKLSMIPWDYNLAFGGFGGMGSVGSSATSEVNSPIDTPVSGGSSEDRPMINWILSNEEYLEKYHETYSEFMAMYFENGYFEETISSVSALISEYVEKDPTAFCSYDEFLTGIDTLNEFVLLRAESVKGQLSGEIPSTEAGQTEDSTTLVDASAINISDMGSFGGGGGKGGNMPTNMTLPDGIDFSQLSAMGDFEAPPDIPAGEEPTAAIEPTATEEPDATTEPAITEEPDATTEPTATETPVDTETSQTVPQFGGNIDFSKFQDAQGGMPQEQSQSSDNKEEYILLGASVLILLLGIGITAFFKRR